MRTNLILILCLLLAGCTEEADNYDATGGKVFYQSYSGKYMLINYWAEWCGPCLKEIPELNLVDTQGSVTVIGVNFDSLPEEELQTQISQLGIEFQVLLNDPSVHYQYDRPDVLPTSFLFNSEQKLVTILIGPQTSEKILSLIKR